MIGPTPCRERQRQYDSRALTLSAIATAACAHVKWFEKYEVAADPIPITTTLALAPFWFAMALVTVLFLATTILERKAPGQVATRLLDKGVRLLRDNADAFMIAVMAAFFIALFAVGGSYLTPDLKTDSELLPWAQLLIAKAEASPTGTSQVARRSRGASC